ncbi:MAG: nuclear transport factor 2 family protein [Myxococcales bacterium]|nr:nuclear transport factor 2 family protein [Myxococcales bacterium]HRC56731.1 nuclear transport factor 2 family protein [Kofleriaceae bacterium]
MPSDLDAAVRGTMEQWRQAYEVRSLDALAKLYAQDAGLVLVQQGEITRGWPDAAALLEARLGKATAVRVRLHDLSIAPIGAQGATVVARMTREISDGVTTVNEDGTLTLALRQAGQTWAIISQHYSYPVR